MTYIINVANVVHSVLTTVMLCIAGLIDAEMPNVIPVLSFSV